MKDQNKSEQQLISELGELRQRVAELEKALQEKETEASLVLKLVPLGIHVCDTDGRITFVNPSQEKVTGYAADELVGAYIWDRLEPGPQKDSSPVDLKHLVSEQPPPTPYVARNVRKNGELYDIRIDWEYKRNPQGRVKGFVSVVSDVTEQKRAEERLRNSERTLRTLIDASPETIVLLAPDGTVLIANETVAHRLGTTVGQMVGHKLQNFLSAEVAANRMGHCEEVVRTGEPIRFEDERLGRCFDNVICPVVDEGGRVIAVAGLGIDQTERKRAEAALRESEERYRRLTESTTDMIYIADRAGSILYANSSAAAALRSDVNSIVGKRQDELFSPETAQRHTENITKVFQTGETLDTDEVYHFGLEEMWLNTRLMPLRDEDGQVASVMGVSRNITARKRAEQALRQAHDELERRVEERTAELVAANKQLHCEIEERKRIEMALRQSEETYRALVEASPDAVLMTDLKRNIVFASQRTAELFGYDSVDDLCRLTATVLVVEEERQRLHANISRLDQEGVRRQIEYIGVRRDGSRFTGEVSSAALRDDRGEPKAFMAMVRDVTERKLAEEAIRQRNTELRTIYEGMSDGIVIVDADTKQVLGTNPAMCRLLGYSEDEMLSLSLMDLHPPTELPGILETFETQANGPALLGKPILFRRKDGSVFYAEAGTNTLTYHARPCVIGFFRDVTKRKQAQEALQREHRTLKHLLQSNDHERQLIACEIHDELAQQLAGAIMQFQTYSHQKEINSRLAAKAFDAGMTMLQQGHREARRLIAGVRPPILDEEGVVPAITHLVNEERRTTGSNIEFPNDVQFDRLAPILENGIYRIAQEGLTNACRHSKSKRVKVSLVQRKDRVRIEVRDWGIGFDTGAVHENRFGLVGIRQRTRLLDGKCSIRSKTGKGTRIVVELPVVARQ